MRQLSPYIPSVPRLLDAERPLWSVMIPTYNCAHLLEKTLESVLSHNIPPELMHIEVVDDCSTQDDPAAIAKSMGQGRVQFYRQPKNLGHVENFNSCLARSRGHLVHLLHGDDYVLPGFYHKMQQAFEHNPTIGAAFCRHLYTDDQGHWQSISPLLQPEPGILSNWLERILMRQHIQTPSIVVRRSTYEALGGFDQRFICSHEDWEMWVRIATRYPVWYESEPLASYRIRSSSITGIAVQTGENIREVRKGLEIVQSYLPAYLPTATIETLVRKNLEYTAVCALESARQQILMGNPKGCLAQLQEAFKCSLSPKVFAYLGRSLLMVGGRQFSTQSA